MSDTVQRNLDDGVLLITLNRPGKKNAFNREQWQAFSDAIAEANEDPKVAVVVLSGAGGNFSSGTDLSDFSGDEPHPFVQCAKNVSLFEKPLIGAASGFAVGGGATLLLHCDVVYVGDSLRMRFPFANLGLVPEFASSYLLPLQIGMRQANELLFTAEWIDAARAVETGIATRRMADEVVLEQAMAKAREMAQWPVNSLVGIKRLTKLAHRDILTQILQEEDKAMRQLAGGPENVEAIMAFLEKREPNFRQFRQ